jgi:signal transduction histidine kinase
MQTQPVKASQFLTGGAEMGRLIRAYDWANSLVGDPAHWPQALLTTLSLMLSSKFPMFLWWGDELVQFYNDAYRPSLGNPGKHPTALGQTGQDCWPEIWDTVKPLIEQVLAGDEGIWQENQLIPIYRNGRLEDVYWTFSYGAVLTEFGQIGGVLVVCQETTEAVLGRLRVEQSETRFRNIVEQAPMAIGLLSGRDMVIEVGNETIFSVWGKDKSITGMRLIDALPEIQGQGFIQLLEEVYETGVPFVGTGLLAHLERHGQLEESYFNLVYTPLRDLLGAVTGVMVLATEVTQQVLAKQKVDESEARFRSLSNELDQQVQERTQQLQTLIQELQRSNQNLQQFAYIASHDLQEPLRKIQSFGDLLKAQYASALGEGVDHLERMQSAARRMSILIKDLLTYSRIATQRDATQSVALNEVLAEVLSDLEVVITETGAQVAVGPLPTVSGDKSQLGQLFQNLLSNALKFRQPGQSIIPVIDVSSRYVPAISLPAWVNPTQAAGAYYCLEVSDNGIGFEEKYLDRMFQIFQRLHGKNQYAGTGIGLAICEKIVLNHGGAITARSQPGNGAIFSMYLPADTE